MSSAAEADALPSLEKSQHPSTSAGTLAELIAQSLPEHVDLRCYHISTPPTRCTPLFAPPPSVSSRPTKSQRTYCESHSLLVTLPDQSPSQDDDSNQSSSQVAVFAIEVQIFTTATLTTVFISKADSTGYLSLLPKPPPRSSSSSSILRSTAATFVSWIIKHRHRSDRPLVLSLFARAQDQYLFPGSGNNGKKHVLDDRALVKWWCKTLDPVLREYDAPPPTFNVLESKNSDSESGYVHSKAHIIVPGHDQYETQSFYPPSARLDPPTNKRWFNAHPLRQIAPHPNAPPRCLVPHFPDDPKARFLLELDQEISNNPVPANLSASTLKHESPTKRGKGQWRSVKTLEQFWDMMAFRQECCSGRLVGFIWILFAPHSPASSVDNVEISEEQQPSPPPSPSPSPSNSKQKSTPKAKTPVKPLSNTPAKRPKRSKFLSKRTSSKLRFGNREKKRTGPIIPRTPRIKSATPSKVTLAKPVPVTTKFYHSPLIARGTLILTQKAYDRMHELFLRLDFSNVEAAKSSTRRWLLETSVVGSVNDAASDEVQARGSTEWGLKITGKRKPETSLQPQGQPPPTTQAEPEGVTILSVKRKRRQPETEDGTTQTATTSTSDATLTAGQDSALASGSTTEPNVLGTGLVRKKPKLEPNNTEAPSAPVESDVNVLSAGLIKKKPKK